MFSLDLAIARFWPWRSADGRLNPQGATNGSFWFVAWCPNVSSLTSTILTRKHESSWHGDPEVRERNPNPSNKCFGPYFPRGACTVKHTRHPCSRGLELDALYFWVTCSGAKLAPKNPFWIPKFGIVNPKFGLWNPVIMDSENNTGLR